MIDGPPEFLVLHGGAVSLVIELTPDETPLWRYWGPRLPEGATPTVSLRASRPIPSFTLDADPPLSIFPTFGVGWSRDSALLASRDGKHFAQSFTRWRLERVAEQGRARFVLDDEVAAIRVILSLDLDSESDVLTLSTVLTNMGETSLDVSVLAAGVIPLPPDAQLVRSFSGRHNNEFIAIEDRLGQSGWRRENRRGFTSHNCFPGAVVTTPLTGDCTGLAYGAQLAWSGNHVQSIDPVDDGRFQWRTGAWLAPGEGILAPGETLASPELLTTCSVEGLSGVAQNFHAAIRARMTWPDGAMRERPIHLNTWEARYFSHRLEDTLALADAAAGLGLERFVLDDGWFHGRDNDTAALGDWWPDETKYPGGLVTVAEHVRGLGMEFGLWVEPEMVNENSELYRTYPDWVLSLGGRPLLTGRNQLVLDLSRPEVAQHLFDRISELLASTPITYLKWDHNRELTTAGGTDGRARYRRQVEAVYGLMARLRAAFPNIEIESCAGGGGRIDAGILRHTHRVWTSDCIDAVSRLSIQRGFLQFFPPEIMGSHVGTAPAHSTGRTQSMAFRAAVAMPGHFGVELDVRRLGENDHAVLLDWINFHKTWRRSLHMGRVWQGTGTDDVLWTAIGEDSHLLVLVYRRDPAGLNHSPSLRLTMLDRARPYRIRRIDPPVRARAPAPTTLLFEDMRDRGVDLSGAWLAESGLPLPPMSAESCAIFEIDGRSDN